MEGNFGRDTYRSGYAAAPLISSTPVSHNHPLYRPCRIRQDDFCSSTKIAARYTAWKAEEWRIPGAAVETNLYSERRWKAETHLDSVSGGQDCPAGHGEAAQRDL